MSSGERLPPPPGFRPLRRDFGGTMSGTHTSMMVNLETENGDGNLEVLQQSQMQNEAVLSQNSCPTKSSLAGNKNVSPARGSYKRFHVDATKVASRGVNASNTGPHLHPCKKSKGLGKHGRLEDNQGTTESRRMQTPINLFEDECVFCHSFRTSEFHGPMILYRKGRIVSSDEGNPNNAIYVHQKCMDWAPQVFFDGDIFVNVEKEISRASRLKCSRCRLPGAALGCYHDRCGKTYHVPCAVMILPERSWDVKNRHAWCPKHASDPLPIMENDNPPCILQNQSPAKEGFLVDCHMEDEQINPLVTPDSLLGQCLDKEGICTDYQREEKQPNQTRTPLNQWVLLGLALIASEKDSLKEFARLTRSTLTEEWDKNVTHVIVGRSPANACGRSYEVLMAIISGKWVVRAEWIVDSMAEPIPGPKICLAEPITVPEISYEVKFYDASRISIEGPKKGRAGAAKGAPKLFSGLHFCLSVYMNPEARENIKKLIAAAEGQVLEAMSPCSLQKNLEKDPVKVYFIYVGDPPRDYASTLPFGEEKEVKEYTALGAHVICHLWLFDAIASYDVRMLDRSDGFTPDMYAKTAS